MHTVTYQTKLIFNDYVRFDSRIQGVKGEGRIHAITIDAEGLVGYIIMVDEEERRCVGGISEQDITLLRHGA